MLFNMLSIFSFSRDGTTGFSKKSFAPNFMADTARKLKKFDVAMKFTGDIITNKATPARIKDEALKEKELIKEDMKKLQNKN